MVVYVPEAGDIVWLEFEPQSGKEIQKTRPALIISPHAYNAKVGLAVCMPITSKIKGYPFELALQYKKIQGAILCDQIRSLDWRSRKAKYICSVKQSTLREAVTKFSALLGV